MVENLEGIITLQSPLTHGSDEVVGTDTKFRRMKFVVNGDIEEIPILSGNSIRGVMRRLGADDLLKRVEIDKVSDMMYYTLFSGGALKEGASARKIDIDIKRNIRKKIPFISIFGTALLQQMLPSKLEVGMAVPICLETREYTNINSDFSIWDLCDDIFYTRKDDLQETKDVETETHQMKYTVEALASGTQLKHSFVLKGMNSIERACFYSILDKFGKEGSLGGSSRIGHGKFTWDYVIENYALYYEFLEDNKEEIKGFIRELEGEL